MTLTVDSPSDNTGLGNSATWRAADDNMARDYAQVRSEWPKVPPCEPDDPGRGRPTAGAFARSRAAMHAKLIAADQRIALLGTRT